MRAPWISLAILTSVLTANPLAGASEKTKSAPKPVAKSQLTGETIEPFVFRTKEPQKMSLINVGSLSLQKRLDMIANAKKSIEVEFFIYNIDASGRIFTQALVKKAQEGVKVRVLVDYGWPIAQLDHFYADILLKNKVEVRYYNPSISFELLKGQFRSHRKALIVDDRLGMTGGRNIADEYFDLAKDYNFLDRDILVEGTMAKAMRTSFDKFWFSNMTKRPGAPKEPTPQQFGLTPVFHLREDREAKVRYDKAVLYYKNGLVRARNYLIESAEDRRILESLKAMKQLNAGLMPTYTCNDSIFAADMPGVGKKTRVLHKEIDDQLKAARKSIYIESPYFVVTVDGMARLESLRRKGLELNILTNSLNSTDAFYTTSTFYPRSGLMIGDGLDIYIYRGHSLPQQDYLEPAAAEARWGVHAKSAVIDDQVTLVGTFNVDPRSRNINSEMGVICLDSKELATELSKDMQLRRDQSVKLNRFGYPVDGTSRFAGASIPKRIAYYLSIPFANIFDFLL